MVLRSGCLSVNLWLALQRKDCPATNNCLWYFPASPNNVAHNLAANGIGLARAQRLLLSGCSAGGAAVLANLDFVASLLPPRAGRVFKGHVDAGWFLDAMPMVPQNLRMRYRNIPLPLSPPLIQCEAPT